MDLNSLSRQYKTELLDKVTPFWENYSKDEEYGGYLTCLLRDGKVFDYDKFIWLQARQVWIFAMLYNNLERRPEWLKMSRHGAAFLQQFGRDERGYWYFSLNRQGKPLVQAYNIFSDCFATMAFGQLFLATKNQEYADLVVQTFQSILQRQENPKGRYNKTVPGSRPLKNFALPMILSNLCLEIEELLEAELVEKTIEACIHQVMEVFYQPELGLILENVTHDGQFSDSFDGRLLSPGHTIEAMWFIMDLGKRKRDEALIEKAVEIVLNTLEYGWDKEYEGVFYFLDVKGYPLQQLEWDQKLWWVHLETLVALLKGYSLTKNEKCLQWFKQVHEYSWSHFPDPEYGEWYGYLNRRGEILSPLKGGKWKGCFHVPRALFQCWQMLEDRSWR